MTLYLLLVGFGILFLLAAVFAIMKVGPLIILQPYRITVEDYRRCTDTLAPSDLHLTSVDLVVKASDGVKLVGWFVPARSPARGTVLYLHGVGDNRISGLPIAKTLNDHGYNVCLIDSRRHGESEGRYCTYGYYERHDVVEVLNALAKSYGNGLGKIGIFGISMGAAIAIQCAAIDSRIAAVVADGCFTDLRTISLDHQKRIIKVRWQLLGELVMKRAERMANFHADDVSPLQALNAVRVPILFVHGGRDSIIRPHYSQILFDRAEGPKEFYRIVDAAHNNTWIIGGREYEERVIHFFDQWLSSTSSTSN